MADAFATMLRHIRASLNRRTRGDMNATGVRDTGWRLRLRDRASRGIGRSGEGNTRRPDSQTDRIQPSLAFSLTPSFTHTKPVMAVTRAEPLSIESLLQKQKEEREAASKVSALAAYPSPSSTLLTQPKFLSKEERAKLAIEKRSQEIREQRLKDEQQRADREAFQRQAAEVRSRDRPRDSPASSHRSGYKLMYMANICLTKFQTMIVKVDAMTEETTEEMTDVTTDAVAMAATTASRAAEHLPQDLAQAAHHPLVLNHTPRLLPHRRRRRHRHLHRPRLPQAHRLFRL